ncbi:MAG: hypothetical protein HKN50_03075 [Gammaproteobacteria bacterium]|nr:hypothetical protein [Gammaproteobacteria bacterium]
MWYLFLQIWFWLLLAFVAGWICARVVAAANNNDNDTKDLKASSSE